VLSIGAAFPALALANRVFVSARSGNNLNFCDNILTPCQTFAGAVLQLNPGGEAIVLDSGGYGPVTITQGVTIEAPAGVTAFIHPPSGDAITINAGASDVVTLRGLTLSVGTNGITVHSVGTLNVENCFITGFYPGSGVRMVSAGTLNVKGTDIKACGDGVALVNTSGVVQASIDHCHLDGNVFYGYYAGTTPPGSSTTTATYSTANNNNGYGWYCGSGQDVVNMEFCTGSENAVSGLLVIGVNPLSAVRFSNCLFANNGTYGVENSSANFPYRAQSRGNNTITGNGAAPTSPYIGSFSPM
jgi:hypothetical protein